MYLKKALCIINLYIGLFNDKQELIKKQISVALNDIDNIRNQIKTVKMVTLEVSKPNVKEDTTPQLIRQQINELNGDAKTLYHKFIKEYD